MLGGGMIPLFVMPSWMVRAGNISPAKWAVLALEGAIWRGFSVTEMFLPCAILVATGVVCFALGTRAFPRTS
jgi:ABC-2 type transport system permease protein